MPRTEQTSRGRHVPRTAQISRGRHVPRTRDLCDRRNSSFLERALVALRRQMCQGCNVTTGCPKVARATMTPVQESMSQGTLGATSLPLGSDAWTTRDPKIERVGPKEFVGPQGTVSESDRHSRIRLAVPYRLTKTCTTPRTYHG